MRCQKYVAVLLVVAFLLSACGVKNDSKSKDSSSEIDITQAESQVSGSSEFATAEYDNNPLGEKNLDDVFFDRPINDEKLVNYKKRVRELLSEEYAYSEDEIVEEYYGSFDSDDSSSDRGLIFLEKEKPLALLYVSFYDSGVEVLDSWQYNLQDNEGEGSSWNSCRINGMINGYPDVIEVKPVCIFGANHSMIYIHVKKIRDIESFALLRVDENQLTIFIDEYVQTAYDQAQLIDRDGDGVFDQSTVYCRDCFTFWNPMHFTYDVSDEGQKLVSSGIELREVPTDPMDTVMQYIEVCSLKEKYENVEGMEKVEEQLDKRLDVLAAFPYDDYYNWQYSYVVDTCCWNGDYLHEFDDGICDGVGYTISLNGNVEGKRATVKAQIIGGSTAEKFGNFKEGKDLEYTLEQRDGKWVITSQKEVDME